MTRTYLLVGFGAGGLVPVLHPYNGPGRRVAWGRPLCGCGSPFLANYQSNLHTGSVICWEGSPMR